jgi:hypothetical protein
MIYQEHRPLPVGQRYQYHGGPRDGERVEGILSNVLLFSHEAKVLTMFPAGSRGYVPAYRYSGIGRGFVGMQWLEP